MKAVRVAANESESVRKELLFESALDRKRKLVKDQGFIEIPVTESFKTCDFALIEQATPEYYRQKRTLADYLDIPDSEKKLLPRGWQVLGDLIIITLNEEIMHYKESIGKALLSLYPRCRTVLLDRGISGDMRKPVREIIAGDDEAETIHKENGCLFKLDAMKVMFSKGNLSEKMRMSKMGKDETVIDMFAGIGYFSIPMAVHSNPKKIIAIEINPVSFGYLKENISLNKVENIVEPICGDCSLLTPCKMANRVIMGYLDGHIYLKHGIDALLPGGILHYHEAVPESIENRPAGRVIETAHEEGRDVKILGSSRIKKFSPGVWHVVVDAVVN